MASSVVLGERFATSGIPPRAGRHPVVVMSELVQQDVEKLEGALWTYGRASLPYGTFKLRPAFRDEALRREFVEKLNAIDGITIPVDAIEKFPSFLLVELRDESRLQAFLRALDWFYDRVLQEPV